MAIIKDLRGVSVKNNFRQILVKRLLFLHMPFLAIFSLIFGFLIFSPCSLKTLSMCSQNFHEAISSLVGGLALTLFFAGAGGSGIAIGVLKKALTEDTLFSSEKDIEKIIDALIATSYGFLSILCFYLYMDIAGIKMHFVPI